MTKPPLDEATMDLIWAAAQACGVLRGAAKHLSDLGYVKAPKAMMEKADNLDKALSRLLPPPITSEPGFDGRDNSSLGDPDT